MYRLCCLQPKNDGVVDRFGRFWLNNGQSQGTVGRRGPSFLQRLTASYAQHELDGGRIHVELGVTSRGWVEALNEQEPVRPARGTHAE